MEDNLFLGYLHQSAGTGLVALLETLGELLPGDLLGLEVRDDLRQRECLAGLRDHEGARPLCSVVEALLRTAGNVTHAAKEIGVTRPTFHLLLGKLGLQAEAFRDRFSASGNFTDLGAVSEGRNS